jgi:hypothetical protein
MEVDSETEDDSAIRHGTAAFAAGSNPTSASLFSSLKTLYNRFPPSGPFGSPTNRAALFFYSPVDGNIQVRSSQ